MNILVAGFGIGALLGIFMTNSTAPEPPCQPVISEIYCPAAPDITPYHMGELAYELSLLPPDSEVSKAGRAYRDLARKCGGA